MSFYRSRRPVWAHIRCPVRKGRACPRASPTRITHRGGVSSVGALPVWINRHLPFVFVGFVGLNPLLGERKMCDECSQLEEFSRSSEQDIIPEWLPAQPWLALHLVYMQPTVCLPPKPLNQLPPTPMFTSPRTCWH